MNWRQQMKNRTMQLAFSIVKFCEKLPNTSDYWHFKNQLLRSGCSVGANYRAALVARSTKEFIAKLGIVEEEADESLYWIELLIMKNDQLKKEAHPIHKEMKEILSIVVSSIKTAKINLNRS